MFGAGIYFADNFSKSEVYSYGDDENQYLLLCEVALGKMHNTLVFNDSLINPKELKVDSIRGMGSNGPDLSQSVLKDGALWPIGKQIKYPDPFLAGYDPDDFTSIKHYFDFKKGKAKKGNKKNDDSEDEEMSSESEEESDDEQNAKRDGLNELEKNEKKITYSFRPNLVHALPKKLTKNNYNLTRNLHYGLNASEYVIYNEQQVRIRYVVQLSKKNMTD